MNWDILLNRAYVPFSKQPAACIAAGKSGRYYAGVRIENISFPLTIPAAQAAVCSCLSEGDLPVKLIVPHRNLEQIDFWLNEFSLSLELRDDISDITCFEHLADIPEKEILPALKGMLADAVVPHSDFPVAALLFTDDRKAVPGVNVEVSDWTKGLCAERVALSKAIAGGHTGFTKMAIHTLKGEISSPCGACRQVMVQHLPAATLDLHHADSTLSRHRVSDLLPFRFVAGSLEKGD